MLRLKFNADLSQAKTETINNVEYMVAPCVSIVEGVLNGIMYNSEEIEKSVDQWNNIPLTNGHTSTSARTPENLESHSIGKILNSRFEDNRLKHDMYLNIEQAKEKNDTIYQSFLNKETIELSTGLMASTIESAGIFNNKEFAERIKDIKPDHLALLTAETGACSIDDGCGTQRNNTEKGILNTIKNLFTGDEKPHHPRFNNSKLILNLDSHNVAEQASKLLAQSGVDSWIEIVEQNTLTYYDFSDGKNYQVSFAVSNDIVTLGSEKTEVHIITKAIQADDNSGQTFNNNTKGADTMELNSCDAKKWTSYKENATDIDQFLANKDLCKELLTNHENEAKEKEIKLNSLKHSLSEKHPDFKALIMNAKKEEELKSFVDLGEPRAIVLNSGGDKGGEGDKNSYSHNTTLATKEVK